MRTVRFHASDPGVAASFPARKNSFHHFKDLNMLLICDITAVMFRREGVSSLQFHPLKTSEIKGNIICGPIPAIREI